MRPLRALTVDFDPIAQAMRDLPRVNDDYYLHKSTGKVIVLSRNLISYLANEPSDVRENLPDWEAQIVPIAREIVINGSPEYIRIPESFGRPEHLCMMRFGETVTSNKLQQEIFSALRGRGSCKRFKEILKDHADERQRWERFRSVCAKEDIRKWLESIGILAIDHNLKPARSTSK